VVLALTLIVLALVAFIHGTAKLLTLLITR
jgi:hypothetical protein